jgi:AbrB family looped-hinge helix DNA binding protein
MPRKKHPLPSGPSGFAEAPQARFDADALEPQVHGAPGKTRLTLGPGGRVVIPAAFREAMGIEEGDTLLAWVEEGEMHLISPQLGAKQAQAMLRAVLGGGESLASELIAERRREAGAE